MEFLGIFYATNKVSGVMEGIRIGATKGVLRGL